MSDGIRSGVNWMRLKLRFSAVGQGADHQRLGQAGHADQQAVAAGEDGDEQFFEDALLADDDLAQLLGDAAIAVVEPFDGGQVAFELRPAPRPAPLRRSRWARRPTARRRNRTAAGHRPELAPPTHSSRSARKA